MPTHRFDTDTTLHPAGELTWTGQVHDGWVSLSGVPNGGFLMCLAVGAAARAVPGFSPITATSHFLRPGVIGPAHLAVEIVKRGRTTSTASVALVQEGKERVRTLVTLGGPDSGPTEFTPAAPPLPRPAEVAPSGPDVVGPGSVRQRFDFRLVPTEGAEVRGWIRFADGREPDLAAVPLVVDCFPPAVLGVLDGVTMSTLELTVHLRRAPRPGWLQVAVRSRALLHGLVEEEVELFDEDGGLVAMSRQLAQLT